MKAGIVWSIPPAVLAARTLALREKVMNEIRARSIAFAAGAEGRMKAGAPWTNRTGAARATLSVTPEVGGDSVTLTYAHGVFYGIYLEFSNQGRFAIVGPSVQADGPALMASFGGIL